MHSITADLLAAAPEDATYVGQRVRAYFAAMLRGLDAGHVDMDACRRRIQEILDALVRKWGSSGPYDWGQFYEALLDAIERNNDRSFFLRDEPLDCDLNLKAVTFQSALDVALLNWMGKPSTPANLAKAVILGTTAPDAIVGRAGRATWLSPLKGAAKSIVDRARIAQSARLAAEARSLIAASGWTADTVIVAMITRRDIGEIRFDAADGVGLPRALGLVGSTVLEARDHRHFRHWPHPTSAPDGYGRTYHFDPAARLAALPPLSYGVQEAVRTPMPLNEFDDCVVIGKLDASGCTVVEPDADFLQAVGGDRPTGSLLTWVMDRL